MLAPLRSAWDALWAIPSIGLYLGLAWAAYLIVLGMWIMLQKRDPAATLSWLLSLALLPYLGFLIYQVLGPQRIKRQHLRRAQLRTSLPVVEAGSSDPEIRELCLLGHHTTALPPSSAHSVRLLVDGAATYDAILADIAQARCHVHLEYYIFNPDRSGTAFRDALIERARAGVQVRLLIDALGSARTNARFLQPLIDAGGEFERFHPSHFGRIWKRTWVNMRSHRKIVVIDGRIGYTGGINVTDEENERLRSDAYRDLHMRLEGNVVRELQQVFIEDWAYASGRLDFVPGVLAQMPPLAAHGSIHAQVLTSGPDSSWETIHRILVGAIHAAKRRVWLTTPYFVPGQAAMMALTSAARAGLDVRLLVPRMSDSLLVTLAARSYYGDLLVAGAKIHEYGPRMLHTKSLLVDDSVCIVGTANFDNRSFRLNFENAILCENAELGAQLAQLFESELAHAPQVLRRYGRPLRERMPEAVARLMSPLL